jgi:hypothetical protein
VKGADTIDGGRERTGLPQYICVKKLHFDQSDKSGLRDTVLQFSNHIDLSELPTQEL